MKTVNITIAIPTYNGEERLPKVLDQLRSQINTEHFSWEVLVVNNNSSDRTAQVVEVYQANWNHSFPLRYCFEPQQGLAFTRQEAVQSAAGEWVGFLDDDNLPELDWVNAVYNFSQQHPRAGAFGGKIKAVFEIEPPKELKPILFYLAIVDRGSQPLIYEPRKNGVPPGAGIVVRRDAWLAHVPTQLLLTGRVGTSMLAGEDSEALLYLYREGWEIWYNPDMSLQHFISANRLERKYFVSLMRGIGLCQYHLRMLTLEKWQKPLIFWIYLLNDTRKAIAYFLRHRTTLQKQDDALVMCKMELLTSTLISPFYLWNLRANRFIHNRNSPTKSSQFLLMTPKK